MTILTKFRIISAHSVALFAVLLNTCQVSASSTNAMPLRGNTQIVPRQWMPLDAMGFACVLSARPATTEIVLSRRNSFQMGRVDTGWNAAKMVAMQRQFNLFNEQAIHQTMGRVNNFIPSNQSVSPNVVRIPEPTSIGINCDMRENLGEKLGADLNFAILTNSHKANTSTISSLVRLAREVDTLWRAVPILPSVQQTEQETVSK